MPLYERRVQKSDIAWLAGIIDGEGSIILHTLPQRGYHLCRLTITNTDEGILSEVRRIFTEWLIFFTFKQIPLGKLGRIPCFRFEVNRRNELLFIFERILPYLKSVKKQRAQLMLQVMSETSIRIDNRRSNRRKKLGQQLLI